MGESQEISEGEQNEASQQPKHERQKRPFFTVRAPLKKFWLKFS
jgi:hypothetical protein